MRQIGHDVLRCREIYTHIMDEGSAEKFIIKAGEIYPELTAPKIINLTQRV